MRAALLASLIAAPLAGQTGPAPLRLVAAGDSVLVYVLAPGSGFMVYRRVVAGVAAASGPYEKRSAAPVVATGDPAVFAGRLGPDLPMALRAVRAVDPGELLRRLRADRFAAGVLTLVSRHAAAALGRLFTDGAVRGADYEYRVVFTGTDGTETARAVTGRVHVADVAPLAPASLKAAGGDHEIQISWRYPTYQGGAQDYVIGFHVYRSDGALPAAAPRRLTSSPVLRNDASGAAFTFHDRDVTTGPYRYQITAVDVLGRESGLTAAAVARVVDHTPPGAPVDLAVRNGDGRVDVTWRMSPEADAAGYHIERSTGLHRSYTRLDHALIPVGRPLWTDTVPGGRQYFYRVIAVDSAGNASPASNPIAAEPEDHTPPAAPSGLVLTTGQHRIQATWAPSGSRDLRGYYVYHGEGATRTRLTGRPITLTQFVDSGTAAKGLNPGGTYTILVSAVDSAFNESVKVQGTITVPDDRPPAPPSAFSARNVEGRYVELSWSASGSLDVRSYAVVRSGAPTDTGTRAVHQFAASVRTWRDTAVIHGGRYAYRLTAVDSAGNVSEARTDSLTFRDFTPPPAPRASSARPVPAGVEVRWERVVGLELVGYNVYRSSLPTGVYRKLTRAPVSLLAFTDSAGHAGFFYTVRAVDRSGNESPPSPVAAVGVAAVEPAR